MDFENMASNAGIDIEDFIEIAQLLVDTTMDDLTKIKQGLDSDNAQAISMAAHSIKGASGSLGLTALSETAAQIEAIAKSGDLHGISEKADLIKQSLTHLENSISTFTGS